MSIDDSALFHSSSIYDPVKAHEYYLRKRKLKGRQPVSATITSPGRGKRRPTSTLVAQPGTPNRSKTKSRRAELLAQREALNKRLDRLREVLDGLMEDAVKKAKNRSGGDPNESSTDSEKDKAPETKVDKADRNDAEKAEKPLTSKQKSDKAKQAKEAYEKEHPNSLSQDVEILREQVKDIQAQIEKAVADARERRNKAGTKQESSIVRPKANNNSNDGPRGR